ncbi:predicted protein [Coccidioides posadasii str. Silveira]|uniref:Predicted protein n=1 Tax=Coccidioides posadasii (strain RMSCC 757 / Silveira) TaxID=443226 RepID=E9DA49_COCPS|nr:predicted protein [Coccidioides posadasii str. Silveira]
MPSASLFCVIIYLSLLSVCMSVLHPTPDHHLSIRVRNAVLLPIAFSEASFPFSSRGVLTQILGSNTVQSNCFMKHTSAQMDQCAFVLPLRQLTKYPTDSSPVRHPVAISILNSSFLGSGRATPVRLCIPHCIISFRVPHPAVAIRIQGDRGAEIKRSSSPFSPDRLNIAPLPVSPIPRYQEDGSAYIFPKWIFPPPQGGVDKGLL